MWQVFRGDMWPSPEPDGSDCDARSEVYEPHS